ncbi:MATE family efflux transporter [Elioraea rosea]|uniref:MATE family efflux transporter n=1 Tax=Elioraea rosea TaxID=2492390 RepID=UPI0011857654|nr:MATE family efflux transporter [Elioraea rosea]
MTVRNPRDAVREEVRATATLAWPIVLTNLAQIAITTTDVVMMGWLGPDALAAGTLGANLYYAFFVIGLGLAMAPPPVMAQALGRRRHALAEVRRALRMGLWLVALAMIPVMVALWLAEPILLALGQIPALAAEAGSYVRAMMWGLIPFLWFMVLRGFTAALERPRPALVVSLCGIAFNAFSNWVLMFGNLGAPALGLVGAGISSSLSAMLMCLALGAICVRGAAFRRYAILGRIWRPHWRRLSELVRIGLPIAGAMGFEVTVFNAAVFLIGLISARELAAHAIAIQLASVTFMVPMGIGQAATVRVGLAAGAGDAAGAGRAGWVALTLGVSFMAAMATLFLTIPGLFVAGFLDMRAEGAPEVAAYAVTLLGLAGLFQVADGAQTIAAGALRGLEDTRVPMVFAGLGYWVFGLPTGAALAFLAGWGAYGVWVGFVVGLAIVAVLLVRRWARRERLGLVPRRHVGTRAQSASGSAGEGSFREYSMAQNPPP